MWFLILLVILVCLWKSRSYAVITGGGIRALTKRPSPNPIYSHSHPSHKDIITIKDLRQHPRSQSEARVIRYIEAATHKKFPTVYTNWLMWKGKQLELDGYNHELNIGVEFSGPLHTKWDPQFEDYCKYFNRIVRDVVKVRTCRRHGTKLMVIDCSLPSRHWKNYVLSRLWDFGVLKEKPSPADYILEQQPEVFRNKQLERELGLNAEWKMAKMIK